MVGLRRTGIDPVPRPPIPAVVQALILLPRALIHALRRLFPEHPLPLTDSLSTNTLVLSRGPPALAVARFLDKSNRRRCCLHPMDSVVPRISLSRTRSSIQ